MNHNINKLPNQFGDIPEDGNGQYLDLVGSQTYLTGDASKADIVFFHGLPFNGEIWSEIENGLDASTSRVDLPGHGRNNIIKPPQLLWMKKLLKDEGNKPLLVGHSLGCEYLLRYAHAHPNRVQGLVLVSPFFLQNRAPFMFRTPALMKPLIKLMGTPKFVAAAAGVEPRFNSALDSAAASLRRPKKIHNFATELARVSSYELRKELSSMLASIKVPVTLVFGDKDPIIESHTVQNVRKINGAGHSPQFTHADIVREIVVNSLAST